MPRFSRPVVTAAVCAVLGAVVVAQRPEVRFRQLTVDDTSGAQRALADRMLKETRAGLSGPWNVALRSPAVGQALMDLYTYYRYNSSLQTRLVEFGILVTAREWSSPYEWQVHYPLALQEGVSATALADLRAGTRPAGLQVDEQAIYDLATEILRQHAISDGTYRRATAALGEQGVVDATSLVGTYVTLAAMLNVGEEWGPSAPGPGTLPRPAAR